MDRLRVSHNFRFVTVFNKWGRDKQTKKRAKKREDQRGLMVLIITVESRINMYMRIQWTLHYATLHYTP